MNIRTGEGRQPRIAVVGAGPCGLTTVKNLLSVGLRNVVCYDESDCIGGNWKFHEDPGRMSVYESTHIITSKPLTEFDDFPMPAEYPDFPSHQQMLAYFESYADRFDVRPHVVLDTRLEQAHRQGDGRWSLRLSGPDGGREEIFDYLLVCSGHHREPFVPQIPGSFSGTSLHSCAYKRPDRFRDLRVLVVGAGNSACDIAVDIAAVARQTCLSMRRGAFIVPNRIVGFPVDQVYAVARFLPRPVVQFVLSSVLRLLIGDWPRYGLQRPPGRVLETHPTLNTAILEALKDGRVSPRVGIERLDGRTVCFANGTAEPFDAIVWATGFHMSFPFLDRSVAYWDEVRTPPLYLKMVHREIPNIFFIGLFQPIGCIWKLADYQARIAARYIVGGLPRPPDVEQRVAREMSSPHWHFDPSPRHAIQVDYHDFRRELLRELAGKSRAGTVRPPSDCRRVAEMG